MIGLWISPYVIYTIYGQSLIWSILVGQNCGPYIRYAMYLKPCRGASKFKTASGQKEFSVTCTFYKCIHISQPHRISVRSVLVNRKTSKDAACTMIIGRGAPLGPSCVKASAVTHSSAIISWLPSNSNFQHTVCINNVEVKTLRPGTFKHMITGNFAMLIKQGSRSIKIMFMLLIFLS